MSVHDEVTWVKSYKELREFARFNTGKSRATEPATYQPAKKQTKSKKPVPKEPEKYREKGDE